MPEPAPYQIELDDGRFIFAPADVDECVHALSTPTPASPEAEDGFYYLSKPSALLARFAPLAYLNLLNPLASLNPSTLLDRVMLLGM